METIHLDQIIALANEDASVTNNHFFELSFARAGYYAPKTFDMPKDNLILATSPIGPVSLIFEDTKGITAIVFSSTNQHFDPRELNHMIIIPTIGIRQLLTELNRNDVYISISLARRSYDRLDDNKNISERHDAEHVNTANFDSPFGSVDVAYLDPFHILNIELY